MHSYQDKRYRILLFVQCDTKNIPLVVVPPCYVYCITVILFYCHYILSCDIVRKLTNKVEGNKTYTVDNKLYVLINVSLLKNNEARRIVHILPFMIHYNPLRMQTNILFNKKERHVKNVAQEEVHHQRRVTK